MAVHPMQRGIRVDQIQRRGRLPREEVSLLEPGLRHRGTGLLQHRGRAVHADHLGLREALSHDGRDNAGAAAQVHHARRRLQRTAPAGPGPGAVARRRIADTAPDPSLPRSAPFQCSVWSRRSKCRLMNSEGYYIPRRRAATRRCPHRRPAQIPATPYRHAFFLPGSAALASHTSADPRGRDVLSVRSGLERLLRFDKAQGEAERGAGRAGRDQLDVAAMRHHQVAGNREPQPGAAPPRAAGKRTEQIVAHRLRQTGAVVVISTASSVLSWCAEMRTRPAPASAASRKVRAAHETTGCGPPAPGRPGRLLFNAYSAAR